MSTNSKDIQTLLKKAGLNSTKPRREILWLLRESHGPFSVEEILERLPEGTCDQATVYRALTQFKETGLVKEVHLGEEFSRFEFHRPHHHHHHIICRRCQRIEALEDCDLTPFHETLKKKGYENIDHHLEFFGLCPDCQKGGDS